MVKYANKPVKKKSKRITTAMGAKIHKKSKQSKKKLKKEAKKMRALGLLKKKNSKELPIPNLYPFKAKIIQEMKARKQANKQTIDKLENQQIDPTAKLDNDHLEAFEAKLTETQLDKQVEVKGHKKYFKEIRKVIQSSDIILEVIDARDPLGSRNKQVQSAILASPGDKRIILVLNKIDLVPLENAHRWQNYLRREFPCVLFKSNLQNQQSNLSSNALFKKSLTSRTQLAHELTESAKAVGPDHLVQIIKQYSKVQGTARAVTVGLIGYPNVGKSSVINSLKRTKACGVSPIPGYTKNIQEVKLDKQVKLIDCPGVIMSQKDTSSLVLQNTIKAKEQDLMEPIRQIVQRVDRGELLKLYQIADFRDQNEFLANIARIRGKFKPGGALDFQRAAKLVIQDWNKGRIRYYSPVPAVLQIQ